MSARSFPPSLPRWACALLVVSVAGVSLVVADLVRHWQEERAAGFRVGGCVRFTQGGYSASLTPSDCDDDQARDVAWEVIEKHRVNRWDLPMGEHCPGTSPTPRSSSRTWRGNAHGGSASLHDSDRTPATPGSWSRTSTRTDGSRAPARSSG